MWVARLLVGFIFFFGAQEYTFCQDQNDSGVQLGIRFNTFYTFNNQLNYQFRVLHTTPGFSLSTNNHNFYIGPQYTYVFEPSSLSREDYETNTYGVNLGYRYYSNELVNKIRLFGQLNFSIYQVKSIAYSLGGGYSTKRIIVENTGSLGIDYTPIKHIHIFSGVGFGSFEGFFLLLDSFAPSGYVGLEYKF